MIPGLICFLLLISDWANPVLGKFCEFSGEIASILSGYAFTVAGFLLTMATVILAFLDKPYFKHYKKNGSLDNLTFSHIIAFAWLGLIFLGSLVVVAYPFPWLICFLISATLNSLFLLGILALAVYGVARQSIG